MITAMPCAAVAGSVLATEPGIDFVQSGYSLATREPETALFGQSANGVMGDPDIADPTFRLHTA